MKEKYLRPAIVNSGTLEGIVPLGMFPAAAVALVGGYAAGRVVKKLLDARPSIKLPSLKSFRSNKDDI